MNNFKNILVIHLNRFKSIEDFKRLFEDNNITTLSPEKTFNSIQDGWKKVFIDKTTGYIIGYFHKDSKHLVIETDFMDFLNNAPSITFSKTVLDVDTILEKIHKHGVESLSKREKEFLDAQYS